MTRLDPHDEIASMEVHANSSVTAHTVHDTPMDRSAYDIRDLDRTMLVTALETHGLSSTEEGDFFRISVSLRGDDMPEVIGLFSSHLPAEKVYGAQFKSSVQFTRGDWGEGLEMCHEWNTRKHQLTASFHMGIPHAEEGEVGIIILRTAVDCSAGVHQELVNDMTLRICGEALAFWEGTINQTRAAPSE